MKRILLTTAALLAAMPGPAFAGTLVLNTGYNHNNAGLLPIGQQDQTWIKIASYEPPTTLVTVAPAWVVSPPTPWIVSSSAQWLGPRMSAAGTSGTSPSRPAYSIFRKCFCLLDGPGPQVNPTINISVRADDNVHVWLNSVTQTLIAPIAGNHSGGPARAYPSQQFPANPQYFRAGRNCIYVLVEDNVAPPGNFIGFTLIGTVNAPGLMPNPAVGLNGNFGPCGCPSEPNSSEGGHGTATGDQHNDSAAVQGIVDFAEARRLAHGEAPADAAQPQP